MTTARRTRPDTRYVRVTKVAPSFSPRTRAESVAQVEFDRTFGREVATPSADGADSTRTAATVRHQSVCGTRPDANLHPAGVCNLRCSRTHV